MAGTQVYFSTTIIAFVFLKARTPTLTDGRSDLHCSGAYSNEALSARLRHERFVNVTGSVVAASGHPLQGGTIRPRDLAKWSWVDFHRPAPADTDPRRAEALEAWLADVMSRFGIRVLPVDTAVAEQCAGCRGH